MRPASSGACCPAALRRTSACRHILLRSYQNMADLGVARGSLPDIDTAKDKMWDAWNTYELVMKEVEYEKWCKCKKCSFCRPK